MKVLDVEKSKLKTSYCVPLWQRDQQMRINTARIKERFAPTGEVRQDPIAVVCFGPSLNDTWEEIRRFKYVISCSGAHKFLVERGIEPNWHVEVDPRDHKIGLMGLPVVSCEYLLASCVHPKLIDHLVGHRVKLWHVFGSEAGREGVVQTFPRGEWALFGGTNVGQRAMSLARALGFTDMHVFGMDCSSKDGKSHADAHPNGPTKFALVPYGGREYYATTAMVSYARQFFHEVGQLPGTHVTLHGDGLLQHMAYDRRNTVAKGKDNVQLAARSQLIASPGHIERERERLAREPEYGLGAGRYAASIKRMAEGLKTTSILDYGCGKGELAQNLPFPIWEYDPAVAAKDSPPRPATLVVCLNVLEHVEPEYLDAVLVELQRVTMQAGYVVVRGPLEEWRARLGRFFALGKSLNDGTNTHIVVGARVAAKKVA